MTRVEQHDAARQLAYDTACAERTTVWLVDAPQGWTIVRSEAERAAKYGGRCWETFSHDKKPWL